MRSTPVSRLRFFAVITVALQVAAGASAYAQTTVGGHVGMGNTALGVYAATEAVGIEREVTPCT